jgi:hypothetical protein
MVQSKWVSNHLAGDAGKLIVRVVLIARLRSGDGSSQFGQAAERGWQAKLCVLLRCPRFIPGAFSSMPPCLAYDINGRLKARLLPCRGLQDTKRT